MVCERCKRTLRSGWDYCPKCGLAVDMADRIAEERGADWQLYEMRWADGSPSEYRYGPEWAAQQLLMEGGYPTPEEAKAAWLRSLK